MENGRYAPEYIAEILEKLRRREVPPREHFSEMVKLGWITTRGELTDLFGDDESLAGGGGSPTQVEQAPNQ